MKLEASLNYFKKRRNKVQLMEEECAIYALEKQIPKKVKISLKGTTDWNTKCRCPVCSNDVFNTLKFCEHCGQALDWGNTK